jgi:hypothetical protein
MCYFKKYFFAIISVVIFLNTKAQRIQNFNVVLAGTSVGVRFTISAGAQCDGYKIWHSIDSTYFGFKPIYDYPGICGNAIKSEDISYTHTNPEIDVVNYYKVELVPVETSPINRIFVAQSNAKVKLFLFPNPIVQLYDVLNLKISNIGSKRLVGFLYNQYGHKLRELDITTQQDLASIQVYDLNDGLFQVWVTDGTDVYTSKFIVVR